MRLIWLIALNGFKEARRNRVTVVVAMFAFVLILGTSLALELTVATFERVITDLGLGLMNLIAAILAIFLGSGLLPREIERRTIYMVVSKPISRSAFVVGRLIGNVITVWFVIAIMATLFAVDLGLNGFTLNASQGQAILGMLLEVVVLTSVAFVFAAVSSQLVTATATFGLYFIGHLSTDLYRLASRAESTLLKGVGTALYYVLPNLDRLDLKSQATYGDLTPWGDVGLNAVHALGYALVMTAMACWLFERRDFR